MDTPKIQLYYHLLKKLSVWKNPEKLDWSLYQFQDLLASNCSNKTVFNFFFLNAFWMITGTRRSMTLGMLGHKPLAQLLLCDNLKRILFQMQMITDEIQRDGATHGKQYFNNVKQYFANIETQTCTSCVWWPWCRAVQVIAHSSLMWSHRCRFKEVGHDADTVQFTDRLSVQQSIAIFQSG